MWSMIASQMIGTIEPNAIQRLTRELPSSDRTGRIVSAIPTRAPMANYERKLRGGGRTF